MRRVAYGIALLLCWAGTAAAGPHTFRGRRLDDALRILQRDGLPIVFSSEIVSSGMRVTAEPQAAGPRQQLDELLAPFDLRAEAGPGGVILIVRQRAMSPSRVRAETGARRHKSATTPPVAAPQPSYTDRVTVRSAADGGATDGMSETTLNRSALQSAGGPLDPDGLAAIHAMPRVSAVDDFRSDFSVRNSPYSQIGIVIDGVPTPWLQHTLYGRSNVGSLAMFGNDSLDSVTLEAGAYPRLYEDALGAQLDLSLREGSRESTRIGGTAGGMTTAFVGEGPIGGERRGSWIAGFRNSYRSWPPGTRSADHPGFLFADMHAKLVYDVSPGQQVSLTVLGGRSTLDTLDELLSGQLATGTDTAGLFTAAWQSTLGPQTVIRQRVFFVGQDLLTTLGTGQAGGSSLNRALGYRGEAVHSMFGGLLEAGADVTRLFGAREGIPGAAAGGDAIRATWSAHAAYVDFSRAAAHGLSFEAGARASDSTLVGRHAVSPWILGGWRLGRGWSVNASAGAARQFPELDAVLGQAAPSDLLPERATHVDFGIEQRFPNGIRWQATLFDRIEHNVLRAPDTGPRLVQGEIVNPPVPNLYRNAISGVSRGLELVVTPERAARVSGWLSYTYAVTRQHDVLTQETFFSDFDRRHTFNGAAMFQLGSRTSAGVVLRAASGVPVPGYFALRNGTLVVGDRLNVVRLPAYVRLDGRVQRRFFSPRHQVAVFAEVVNVMNRANEGLAIGTIQPTGEALGFSQPLVPRRASIGIQINWSRTR